MLISASPVFWSTFVGEKKEKKDDLEIDVEPKAFKEMLRFVRVANKPKSLRLCHLNIQQIHIYRLRAKGFSL